LSEGAATITEEARNSSTKGFRSSKKDKRREIQDKDERPSRLSRRLPLLPALLFVVVVTQVPFVVTLYYSTLAWNLTVPLPPHFIGLGNYKSALGDPILRTAIIHTIEITVGVVVLGIILGTAIAVLLDRKFIGRSVVRTLILTPFFVVPVAAGLIWKTTIYNPLYGVLDAVLHVVGLPRVAWLAHYPMFGIIAELVWRWTPFMTVIILAGLQSQDESIVEAARVDGAGPWKIFRAITLPQLSRYLQLAALLGAIYLLQTFGAIDVMTQGGPGNLTVDLPFEIYQRAFVGFNIGLASAMGVLVVVGTLVVALVLLRSLSKLLGDVSVY